MVSSTTTFCAGVFCDTSTETRDAGRLSKQLFRGVRETVAGVDGGAGLRVAEAEEAALGMVAAGGDGDR